MVHELSKMNQIIEQKTSTINLIKKNNILTMKIKQIITYLND